MTRPRDYTGCGSEIAMPELWERQDTDTKKSWQAFCWYRDMGLARSLSKVALKHSKSLPLLKRWSPTHNWQTRVAAWDEYEYGLMSEELETARRQLIVDEFEDYKRQLETWRKAFEQTPLLERTHRKQHDDGSITEFVGLNVSDLHQLTKWRADIDKQARLALSLPDKYSETKTEVTGKSGGPLKVEFVFPDVPTDD